MIKNNDSRLLRLALGGTLVAAALAVSGATFNPPAVIDLNTTVPIEGSSPELVGKLGAWTLFEANGLWRTDGTPAGTSRVHRDDNFRVNGSLVELNGLGYFAAEDSHNGMALWVTDGTSAGTRWLMPLPRGRSGNGRPRVVGVLQNRLVVSGFTTNRNDALWLTDATPAGTVQLLDGNIEEKPYVFHGGKLYFVTNRGFSTEDRVWVTNGTVAGTHEIGFAPAISTPHSLIPLADRVLVGADDATPARTRRLWSIDVATDVPEFLNVAFSAPAPAVLQNVLLFAGASSDPSGASDIQLWRTDGTAAGTVRVIDFTTGPEPTRFDSDMRTVGARVVFTIDGKIWSTDGTAAQTIPVNAPATYRLPAVAGDYVYYFDREMAFGPALRTDGTPAGTRVLEDMITWPADQVVGDSDAAYLMTGTKLMRHEPATSRTTVLATFDDFPYRQILSPVGDNVLFTVDTRATGAEPWISDGTPEGTRMLVDANPPDHNDGSSPSNLVDLAGTLYFIATGQWSAQSSIWRSSGAPAGTWRLDAAGGAVREIWPVGDRLYYKSSRLYSGNIPRDEYWRVRPGDDPEQIESSAYALATRPPPRVQYRGETYSTCPVPGSWEEALCKLDAAGVLQRVEGVPLSVEGLHVAGDRLYLRIYAGGLMTLWVGDGTGAGTRRVGYAGGSLVEVGNITPAGDRLYFSAQRDSTNGVAGVFRSDDASDVAIDMDAPRASRLVPTATGVFVESGFPATFTFYPDDPDAVTDPLSGALDDIVVLSDGVHVLLQVTEPDYLELWISDGDIANTEKVYEFPRVLYSGLSEFFHFDGRHTFFASARSGMLEIWQANDAIDGALKLGEVEAYAPSEPTLSRGKLFFAATAYATGRELYVIADGSRVNAAPTAVADDGGGVAGGASISIDVLANDRDPDGGLDYRSVRIVRQPSLGSATVAASGRITYAARSGESGGDSFTYVVADDEQSESNVATVSVTLHQPAPPPPNNNGGANGSAGRSGGGGSMRALDALAALVLFVAMLFSSSADRNQARSLRPRAASAPGCDECTRRPEWDCL